MRCTTRAIGGSRSPTGSWISQDHLEEFCGGTRSYGSLVSESGGMRV